MSADYRFEKALSPAIPDHHPIGPRHPLREWDQHTRGLHAAVYDHTFPCWVHAVLPLLRSGEFQGSLTPADIDTVSVVAPNTSRILEKLFLSTAKNNNIQDASNWLHVCSESVGPHSVAESSNLSHSCYAGRLLSTVQRLSDDIISGVEYASQQTGTLDTINSHSYVCQSIVLHAHLLLRLRSSLSAAASTSQPREPLPHPSSTIEAVPTSASSCSSVSSSYISSPSTTTSEHDSDTNDESPMNKASLAGWEWFEDTNDGFDNLLLENTLESPGSTFNTKGQALHDDQTTATAGLPFDDTSNLFTNIV